MAKATNAFWRMPYRIYLVGEAEMKKATQILSDPQ